MYVYSGRQHLVWKCLYKCMSWQPSCAFIKLGFYCSLHAIASQPRNMRLANVGGFSQKKMMGNLANFIWDALAGFSTTVVTSIHHPPIIHPRQQPSKLSQLSPLASSLTSMLSPLFSWTGSFFSSRLRQPHFQASHWKQSKAAQGGAISSGSNSSSGKW